MKMVIELATKEYYDRREQLVAAGGGPMPPIISFLHYHIELHKILERRELTSEDIVELREKNSAILEALRSLSTSPAQS
jgi:hypothetical protein